jgi:hypothetical protein
MFLCINYLFDIMFMVMKIDCQENIQINDFFNFKILIDRYFDMWMMSFLQKKLLIIVVVLI